MSATQLTRTVLHIITGLGHGGAENVLDRLVRSDRSNRHIIVSLHTEGALGPGLRAAGCEVHALGFERGSLHLGGLFQLWRIIRGARSAVVQTWMYHPNLVGGVLARLAGVSAIYWNLRRTELEQTSVKTRLIGKLGAWLSGAVPDRVICCATSVAEAHARHGYDASKMVVIPNGIDTGRFAPDPAAREAGRAALGVAPDATLIGCVARFHPDKDHRSLFAALRR
ncbi:glycosyltransferase, partial [Sphingomonas sp.]|uniref:glycosyltransferase n=1 Tax=Sphingomonas sp. TaxID=28214 RepID=UPI00286D9898